MTVTIQLVGVFRSGRFNDTVREYPAATRVREVVDELDIPGPLLGVVLINGIHAGIDDILNEGDTLCLLPFIDGG
jgi:molybdopterin synthase sulfur carrier subunit